MSYTLAITGPIGSGKSTLLKSLRKKLNCSFIPEFIDGDPIFGLEMLKRFIDGSISSLTFQSYILDYYRNVKINYLDSNKITICEKMPYDSVYCFGSIALKSNKLTQKEFDVLVDKLNDLNMFDYKDTLIVIDGKNNQTNILNQVLEIINDDIKNGVSNRSILLNCDLETCKQRISLRNRSGEDNYDEEYLKSVCEWYESLQGSLNPPNFMK